MSNLLQDYKSVAYDLPEEARTWQLSAAGFENLDLTQGGRRKPGPEEIAFRTDVNSICFSDVKIISAGDTHPRLVGYNIADEKVVPGHELALTVVEVGDKVKDKFKVGDRFIVQADMLKYGKAVGYDVWGGFCDYGIFGPEVQEYLIPVTNTEAGYSEVALVEPWACVQASYARADVGELDKAVWLCGGAGPMGQMHLVRMFSVKMSGQAPNMETVLLTDISEPRLESVRNKYADMAAKAGVRFEAWNPNDSDFNSRLDELAPEGFDYLVALCPVPDVIEDAMKRLRIYGVLNLFAGFKRGTGTLNMGDIHYDQITVTGNSGSRIDDMKEVLKQVESSALDTNSSAWAVVGIEGAKEGVLQVKEGKAYNKVLIYPQCKDLPLTPIEDLADQLPFPAEVKEQVSKGIWSKNAEEVLLESKWAR
ncbi:MAG: zinc-binding dehydrogenase [Candidatus Omnitrophica bacterium]|nr:zinc-binding dehydrogenase [Candidatus Omnitrophota bacterium]